MLRFLGLVLATLVAIAPFALGQPHPARTGAPAPPDSILAWLAAGRVALADSVARERWAWAQKTYGAESAQSADALDLVIEVARGSGKGAQPGVRDLAVRSVSLRRQLSGPDDPKTLAARDNLARILLQKGDWAEARDSLLSVLAARRRDTKGDPLAIALAEQRLAVVLNNLGEAREARTLVEHALESLERLAPPSDPRIGDARNDLANVLISLGDYESARLAYVGAQELYERAYGADAPDVALVLANMARLQYRMGDYTGSRASYLRAAAIQEAVALRDPSFTGNLRRLAFTLTFLGETLDALGDYDAARDTLERACKLRESVLGKVHASLAPTLMNLAQVYKHRGELEPARATYARTLEVFRATSREKSADYAVTLQSLAEIQSTLGRHAEAESLSRTALESLASTLGPDHHLTARCLATDATIRLRRGDLSGAASAVERALAVHVAALGANSVEVAETQALLARVRWLQGDRGQAFELALRAEGGTREHLRATGRLLSEREALAYASIRAAGLGVALSAAQAGLGDSALVRLFDSVVRSRAVVLDEMAARHQLLAPRSDTTAVKLATAVAAAARRYSNLVVRGPDEDHPARFTQELAAARADKEAAERALADVSSRARVRQDEARHGARDILPLLPEGSCLVSFVRFDRVGPAASATASFGEDRPEYAAIVSDTRGGLTLVSLGPAERLERAVAAWRREAATGLFVRGRTPRVAERAYRKAGDALRRLVWDPVEKSVGAAHRVFIIPDGALSYIAFDALPAPRGGYLIDGARVFHYLSAERDLAGSPSANRNRGLVAFGGLDFEWTSGTNVADAGPDDGASRYRGALTSCGIFRETRFTPLPGTIREVEEISRIWSRASSGPGHHVADAGTDDVLLVQGSSGHEGAFKRAAPGAGTLHVASHGFFLDETCAPSGGRGIGGLESRPIAASGGAKAARPKAPSRTPRPGVPYENPLLLAGLAFSGANQRQSVGAGQEDGILTAEEIAAMDLSRVRWAVLSACDTGSGRATSSEGLLGLRRAFRTAGVATLIMSLWQADDEGTRRWMRDLYEAHLVRGRGAADAAREASRLAIGARRRAGQATHPFFWAGFVAVGDWR